MVNDVSDTVNFRLRELGVVFVRIKKKETVGKLLKLILFQEVLT